MTDPTQQPDDMMGFLNRLAMKVLEAPISQRELMYEDIRQDLVETLPVALKDPSLKEEKARELMEMLRALVLMIESGGGGGGGRA
jgi:hypothetical protein